MFSTNMLKPKLDFFSKRYFRVEQQRVLGNPVGDKGFEKCSELATDFLAWQSFELED